MTNTNDTRTMTLIEALGSADHNERVSALMQLGSIRTPEVADALVAHLGTEGDCQAREATTWATVSVGELAVPGVLRLLGDRQPMVRMQAAHVLSKIGNPEHLEAILPLVADRNPYVAVKAYRAAANTGDERAVPALADRLGHGDPEQRDALTRAFETLGELGVPALIEALSDAEAEVRAHAAETLGFLGGETAAPAVSPLAGLLNDPDADVRLAAVSALGVLDREQTQPALEAAAASEDAVVAQVAKRLLG